MFGLRTSLTKAGGIWMDFWKKVLAARVEFRASTR